MSAATAAVRIVALLAAVSSGCGDEAAEPSSAGATAFGSASPAGGSAGTRAQAGAGPQRAGAEAAAVGGSGRAAMAGRRAGGSKASSGAGGTASSPPADAGQAATGTDASDVDAGAPSGPQSLARDEILTQRYDNARTGANLAERTLTRARASGLQWLGSWPVDGQVYAQVLIANGVDIGGSARSVAIVATTNNSVYAFDADAEPAAALLWHRGGMGELGQASFCARNVEGPNGILSTPVIDAQKQRLFVVARDCDLAYPPEAPRCEQRLFQLKLDSGEIEHSVRIAGSVPVTVDASSSVVEFDPSAHWNRPGLLLAGDALAIAFGSGPAGNQHEEDFVYHGWVFRYDVTDLERAPDVYCTTPRGRGGSVWQAGAGPAADEHGIYFTGANGIQADSTIHPPEQWPSAPLGQEDCVVRLPLGEPFPTPDETFTQYADTRDYLPAGNIFQYMESGDNGFGSSGPMLIPDSQALLVGTKAGLVYLLDRETLRPLQAPLSAFDKLPLQPEHTLYLHSWWGIPMITQAFVFWRIDMPPDGQRFGYAYAWASDDVLRSFRYDYQTGALEQLAAAGVTPVRGGGNLTLSANGSQRDSGVLWAASRSPSKNAPAGALWAFDPITLEILTRIDTPAWAKFNPPTVAHGRVFLPSTSAATPNEQQVLIYGLAQ